VSKNHQLHRIFSIARNRCLQSPSVTYMLFGFTSCAKTRDVSCAKTRDVSCAKTRGFHLVCKNSGVNHSKGFSLAAACHVRGCVRGIVCCYQTLLLFVKRTQLRMLLLSGQMWLQLKAV